MSFAVPQPRNINQASRQARILQRAKGMFLPVREGGQGYTAYANNGGPKWSVTSPEFKTYAVNLQAKTCSCPDFEEHADFCKHLWGLQLQLEHEADLEAAEAYEAEQANAQGPHGTDPYYELD